ncbi:MAG: hypothetical protein R3E86_12365 [Pseudomonadales bacterium]
MYKAPLATSLILAGVLLANGASAESPYRSWAPVAERNVSIEDSFNRDTRYDSTVNEMTEVSLSKSYSSDDDWTQTVSEDNDWISKVQQDNDWTQTISEDNDTTTDVDVDLQFAMPTLTSHKFQDQDAGHQADTQVYGSASGHSVGVEGATNLVSAGNEETVYYGPALVNTNVNQAPVNNAFVGGSNIAPIFQANTMAGRDLGDKGVFAPIGNTSAMVGGDVSQSSGASVGQSGNAANAIADPISSSISR